MGSECMVRNLVSHPTDQLLQCQRGCGIQEIFQHLRKLLDPLAVAIKKENLEGLLIPSFSETVQ